VTIRIKINKKFKRLLIWIRIQLGTVVLRIRISIILGSRIWIKVKSQELYSEQAQWYGTMKAPWSQGGSPSSRSGSQWSRGRLQACVADSDHFDKNLDSQKSRT
jgi:hypothetical protein